MLKFTHSAIKATLIASALLAGSAGYASAQDSPFAGCNSSAINEQFVEFGRTHKMSPELREWLNNPEQQIIEPWKPFDNVHSVGICWISAWLVNTDDGAVLIDTVYGGFTDTLIENIKKSGVDLADIKYVLMTHGHFDHTGGAAKLKPLLPNARFVMTQDGWDEAIEGAKKSENSPISWKMIEQDMVVKDGDVITLGGNNFKVIESPGHTWGTASYTYDVKDGDDTYRAITIGGLGLNAIDGPEQVEAFIASVDRIKSMVESPDEKLQVHLSAHGFSNNVPETHAKLDQRKLGEPNVFVDPDALLKQIAELRSGAVERLAIEKAK